MVSPLSLGINYIFWIMVGGLRLVVEKITWFITHGECERPDNPQKIKISEICACVACKNEEIVVRDTLNSLKRLLSDEQIFLVSDGSTDNTVAVAEEANCQVLSLSPNRGKARALKALVRHFDLTKKFKLILFVDADSVLPADYLAKALPVFENSKVAALSAYSQTQWEDNRIVAHRQRLYTWGQVFSRYGQSWSVFNANWIVPGFASIMRSTVLDQIDMDAKGIVTEDLYMTLEIHKKKLGQVYHSPHIFAYTQDPNNLTDYLRQIDRWNLGLWQSLREHRLWLSPVCFFLCSFLIESLVFGLLVITAPFILLLAMAWFFVNLALPLPPIFLHIADYYLLFIFAFILINYLITVLVAIIERNFKILKWELSSLWLYYLDTWSLFKSIPLAFRVTSNGSWVPPTRR